MKNQKSDLFEAGSQIGLSSQEIERLWQTLTEQTPKRELNKFDLTHVLYYAGAFIVIVAMSLFFGVGWEALKGAERERASWHGHSIMSPPYESVIRKQIYGYIESGGRVK